MEDLKVSKICTLIAELKDSDISQMEREIDRQITYAHPLKAATAARVNEAGKKNKEVLSALVELKKLIERGKPKQ